MQIVNKEKKELNDNKLQFNTYCIFSEKKQDVNKTIGLMFKDYIESLKVKK